tara:strand:- start:10740 stop:11054 length:315 start_codon:yes stop_codon:yes gene_type:complete
MRIKKSKDIVEKLLKEQPHLRDDDNKLLASVWYIEIKQMKLIPEHIYGFEVLSLIAEKMLSNAESIRRCRAKLQELNVNLRGKVYEQRHKEIKVVKDDLQSFNI